MLELHSPEGAFEQIEAYLRERGFFAPGGEQLEADLYLGYGLSEPLRRTAAPAPPEPCPLPLAAVAVRDTSQGLSLGHVSVGQWERSWTDSDYAEAVEAVRTAIGRGDVYQVNLVQHLAAPFEGSAGALAGRLGRGGGAAGLALALLVAIGIGIHNLGEGLAIGASFAVGELQLGTFLIVGFMIHNVTEGLGIAAPVAKSRVSLAVLVGLALIAGAPAILGAWLGGYASSDVLGPLFFAIAAGAAFQVVVEVGRYVARQAPGGLASGHAVGGFLAGIAAMYVTGVLVG